MKFKRALGDNKISSVSSKDLTIRSSKYPKILWPWDTGITDRGITGLMSDIKVLTNKEKLGLKKC